MDIETRVCKGNGGWEAESYVGMGPVKDTLGREGVRKLCISTHKAGAGVVTRATVYVHSEGVRSHAFGLSRYGAGDYSRLVAQRAARCTEKTVREQHTQALEDVEALFAEAVAHYEAQAQRRAVDVNN